MLRELPSQAREATPEIPTPIWTELDLAVEFGQPDGNFRRFLTQTTKRISIGNHLFEALIRDLLPDVERDKINATEKNTLVVYPDIAPFSSVREAGFSEPDSPLFFVFEPLPFGTNPEGEQWFDPKPEVLEHWSVGYRLQFANGVTHLGRRSIQIEPYRRTVQATTRRWDKDGKRFFLLPKDPGIVSATRATFLYNPRQL